MHGGQKWKSQVPILLLAGTAIHLKNVYISHNYREQFFWNLLRCLKNEMSQRQSGLKLDHWCASSCFFVLLLTENRLFALYCIQVNICTAPYYVFPVIWCNVIVGSFGSDWWPWCLKNLMKNNNIVLRYCFYSSFMCFLFLFFFNTVQLHDGEGTRSIEDEDSQEIPGELDFMVSCNSYFFFSVRYGCVEIRCPVRVAKWAVRRRSSAQPQITAW